MGCDFWLTLQFYSMLLPYASIDTGYVEGYVSSRAGTLANGNGLHIIFQQSNGEEGFQYFELLRLCLIHTRTLRPCPFHCTHFERNGTIRMFGLHLQNNIFTWTSACIPRKTFRMGVHQSHFAQTGMNMTIKFLMQSTQSTTSVLKR